jgi:hypothetical protein
MSRPIYEHTTENKRLNFDSANLEFSYELVHVETYPHKVNRGVPLA